MIPDQPDPARRRADRRLAWIIVCCSALATVTLVVVGVAMLWAPLTRWTATLPATVTNAQDAADPSDQAAKNRPEGNEQETDLVGDNAADLPAATGELQKADANQQDDEAQVRRGEGTLPDDEEDAPPLRIPTT